MPLFVCRAIQSLRVSSPATATPTVQDDECVINTWDLCGGVTVKQKWRTITIIQENALTVLSKDICRGSCWFTDDAQNNIYGDNIRQMLFSRATTHRH